MITEDDIRSRKWVPSRPNLLQHALAYTRALAEGKKYTLMVWPEHCLIGTPGHNVVEPINGALQRWSGHNLDIVHYIPKGSCPLVEMYSGLKADMEIQQIQSTQLNRELIGRLLQAERVLVCGQALSHCVKSTLSDLLDNWPPQRLKDVVLLKDAASSVGGFEAAGEAFYQEMLQRGARVCPIAEAFAF